MKRPSSGRMATWSVDSGAAAYSHGMPRAVMPHEGGGGRVSGFLVTVTRPIIARGTRRSVVRHPAPAARDSGGPPRGATDHGERLLPAACPGQPRSDPYCPLPESCGARTPVHRREVPTGE